MVSQNTQDTGIHYWLAIPLAVEKLKTEIIAARNHYYRNTGCRHRKCQKFSSANVTEFTRPHTSCFYLNKISCALSVL